MIRLTVECRNVVEKTWERLVDVMIVNFMRSPEAVIANEKRT